jgi:hypothetical protein
VTNGRFLAIPLDALLKTLCVCKTDLVAGDRSMVSMLNFLQNRFQVFGDRFLARHQKSWDNFRWDPMARKPKRA